ncbi:molybdopterin-dependent oxidoreductase [bacterium]|nr:molybdopterin-dependent oxidoreductase [bacterium]
MNRVRFVPPGPPVPPGQIVVEDWPRLDIDPPVDSVPLEGWRLRVWGAVEKEVSFSAEDLFEMGAQEMEADIHCVTTWSVMGSLWEGIPLERLVAEASPIPQACHSLCHGLRRYDTNLLLEDLVAPTSFLVWKRNGKEIPHRNGGPFRFIIPHLYLWKSAKWATGIEILPQEKMGFWEQRGYHHRGDPWKEERFSVG